MKCHSFVQLAQGVGTNSWWECPDWALVSILCVSITANEKGEVRRKPQLCTQFYLCTVTSSPPHSDPQTQKYKYCHSYKAWSSLKGDIYNWMHIKYRQQEPCFTTLNVSHYYFWFLTLRRCTGSIDKTRLEYQAPSKQEIQACFFQAEVTATKADALMFSWLWYIWSLTQVGKRTSVTCTWGTCGIEGASSMCNVYIHVRITRTWIFSMALWLPAFESVNQLH